MIPTWDQVGKLVSVRDSHTVNVGQWQSDSTEPDLHLLPRWSEQHGSGAPTIVAQDTVAHDGWDRVTAIEYFKDGATLTSASYSFDADGNLYPAGESRSYHTQTTQLMSRGDDTYAYDPAGNVETAIVGSDGWAYVYDALERLIEVRKNGALLARYAYDVLGRRIVKRVYLGSNAGYLRMIYQGDAVGAEGDSTGNLTLGYSSGLGPDNLVAIHKYADGTDFYVVQDALHSVRGLSRRDATWIASWRYGIYGAALDSAGAAPFAIRYRWTGRELDVETGLYYFRARYYDPTVQRFVQEDPIGFDGGANLYAYGDGNPTNGRDATGLRLDPETIIPHRETLNPHWGGGGPSVYIDGAWMGSGAGAFGMLDGLLGKPIDAMAWSPPTTVERRAAMVDFYNTVGAIEAAVSGGLWPPKGHPEIGMEFRITAPGDVAEFRNEDGSYRTVIEFTSGRPFWGGWPSTRVEDYKNFGHLTFQLLKTDPYNDEMWEWRGYMQSWGLWYKVDVFVDDWIEVTVTGGPLRSP